jgi:hypothetical protein
VRWGAAGGGGDLDQEHSGRVRPRAGRIELR